MKNMNKKAFTLVEVLIVLIIISILFVVLVSNVDFSITKSKTMTVQTDFLSYQLAIEEVCLEKKELVDNMTTLRDHLNVHLDNDLMVQTVDGSLTSDRKDPWGQEYYFEYSRSGGDKGKLTITSAGTDMQFGTSDDISMSVTYKNTPYGYKVVKE